MVDKIPANNKIFRAFFIDYRTISEVSKELYGKKRIGFVSDYFKRWNDLKYLDEKHITIDKKSSKGKEFTQAFTGYRLNLKPYLRHVKESSNINFNNREKDILNYIFSFKKVREMVCKHADLFEGITIFLERAFLYKTDLDWPHRISQFFRKAYFVKNKKCIKLDFDIYIDRLKEIEEFEKVSHGIFNQLKDKIKVISSFAEQDYFDLTTQTELRKYQYMPN